MTIARLARCTKLTPGDRYTCNCGADSQNERAAMLDRVEASDAAVHSHRVDDGSLETAATTERTFPRVSLSTVVPGSLVEIASGDIGIAIRFDGGNLRPIAWITTGHVGTMPASATVSLRATPTELDALTSADGSQPAEDPLAIPLSRYADGLEQVAAQGGCSVATADKLLRAVVAIRCAISGEPLSRAADASNA